MQDKELAQHQVSMLLFIALACGIGMFLFTKVFGTQALSGNTLKKNSIWSYNNHPAFHTSFEVLRILYFLMKTLMIT
jgi:hypothetical protein